jgi:hypothetical protein
MQGIMTASFLTLLLSAQENLERHGDGHGSVIVVENNQLCSDTT